MCRWTLVTLANTGQFRKVRTTGTVSNDFPKARAAGHAIGDGSHPAKKARTIHSRPVAAAGGGGGAVSVDALVLGGGAAVITDGGEGDPEQACCMVPCTASQNRPEEDLQLASSEAYDKSMHDEMESYFRKPLDQFIADLEAETSSAAGFSTGNSAGSTIGDTELWSFDEADEKSILITHFGQQTAVGFVYRWWQHVALVVMTVLGLQAVFEPIYNHASSTEAGSRFTASILEALGSKILPLLWLILGILLGAAAYCYLPVWTKHSLRDLSLETHEAYTMNAIHKKMLRHYCAVLPLTHLYKFCLALWSSDCLGSLMSGKTLILFFRHFFSVAVFIAVVFWFQVTYATIMRVRTLAILVVPPVLCSIQLYLPYELDWFLLFCWQLGSVMLQTSLTTHLKECAYILATISGVAVQGGAVLRCALPVYFAHTLGIVALCAKFQWMSHSNKPFEKNNCYCSSLHN